MPSPNRWGERDPVTDGAWHLHEADASSSRREVPSLVEAPTWTMTVFVYGSYRTEPSSAPFDALGLMTKVR